MEPAPELEVSPVSFRSYSRVLSQNRNFRRLWGAQVVSELGDWFYTLAIYNLLRTLHAARALATNGLAGLSAVGS